MKIVFLDFDNVLNDDRTTDWIKPGPGLFVDGHSGLDEEKVRRLNRLNGDNEGMDVRFVFSTSWRKWYKDEEMLTILRHRGFEGTIHETAPRTPLHFSYTSRGTQIREWLENAKDGGYLPTSFVVLDDLTTEYCTDTQRQVQTEHEDGLTDARADQALEILNRPCEESEYLFYPEIPF